MNDIKDKLDEISSLFRILEDRIEELSRRIKNKDEIITLQRNQIRGLEEGIEDYQKQIKEFSK